MKVLVKDGQAIPRIGVFATREGLPSYTRYMNSSGEAEAVLSGLGPGRFRVNVSAIMAGGMPGSGKGALQETHEVDGATDLELTLDLR